MFNTPTHTHITKNGCHQKEMKMTADACHCLSLPYLPSFKPSSLSSSSRCPPTSNDNLPLLMLWSTFPQTSFSRFSSSSSSCFFLQSHSQGDPAVTSYQKCSMMQKLSNPAGATGGDLIPIISWFIWLNHIFAMLCVV